jgi:hypothetical protein
VKPAEPRRETDPARLLNRALLCGAFFLLPLVVFLDSADPFHLPKRVLLHVVALVIAAGWMAWGLPRVALRGKWRLLVTLPLVIGIVDALARPVPDLLPRLLDDVAACVLVLAVLDLGHRRRSLVAAIVAGAAGVAVVALLQLAHVDPLVAGTRWVDWSTYADKMRAYATLGNPNLVGALCAATLPLALGLASAGHPRRRRLALAATGLLAAALFASFSKGAVLAGLAATVLLVLRREWRRPAPAHRRLTLGGGGAALAVLFVVAVPRWSKDQDVPGRPLASVWTEATAGRVELWRESVAAAGDAGLLGLGPGGLGRALARTGSDARHAHNDYLETWLDGGVPGIAALAIALSVAVVGAFRPRRGDARARAPAEAALSDAVGCALVALTLVALVDFPLHTPVSRTLFFALAGLAVTSATPAQRRGQALLTRRLGRAAAILLFVVGAPLLARPLVGSRLLWRAEGLRASGRPDLAAQVYERAADRGADPFRVHYGRACVALDLGDPLTAIEQAAEAHAVFPRREALVLARDATRTLRLTLAPHPELAQPSPRP